MFNSKDKELRRQLKAATDYITDLEKRNSTLRDHFSWQNRPTPYVQAVENKTEIKNAAPYESVKLYNEFKSSAIKSILNSFRLELNDTLFAVAIYMVEDDFICTYAIKYNFGVNNYVVESKLNKTYFLSYKDADEVKQKIFEHLVNDVTDKFRQAFIKSLRIKIND